MITRFLKRTLPGMALALFAGGSALSGSAVGR